MAQWTGRPRHIRVTIHTDAAYGKTELTRQLVVAPSRMRKYSSGWLVDDIPCCLQHILPTVMR